MDSYRVYMNFEHHLMDESELISYIEDWISWLTMQGYFGSQIIQIVFDGPYFRTYFLNEEVYIRIRTLYEKRLDINPSS